MSTIINWKREFYGFAVEMSAAALAPIDADPTTPPEGLIWYSGTAHQFMGQYAGAADVLASKSYIDAVGAKAFRQALATTPGAAGADGTLVDLSGTPIFAVGDRVDGVMDQATGTDISSFFYGTVVSDGGKPALKQNKALGAGQQGKTCTVIGRQA